MKGCRLSKRDVIRLSSTICDDMLRGKLRKYVVEYVINPVFKRYPVRIIGTYIVLNGNVQVFKNFRPFRPVQGGDMLDHDRFNRRLTRYIDTILVYVKLVVYPDNVVDGRNQSLFNYILTLQSNDFSKEEARETIRIINQFVLKGCF